MCGALWSIVAGLLNNASMSTLAESVLYQEFVATSVLYCNYYCIRTVHYSNTVYLNAIEIMLQYCRSCLPAKKLTRRKVSWSTASPFLKKKTWRWKWNSLKKSRNRRRPGKKSILLCQQECVKLPKAWSKKMVLAIMTMNAFGAFNSLGGMTIFWWKNPILGLITVTWSVMFPSMHAWAANIDTDTDIDITHASGLSWKRKCHSRSGFGPGLTKGPSGGTAVPQKYGRPSGFRTQWGHQDP